MKSWGSVGLVAVVSLCVLASSAFALKGVVEQTIELPCPIQLDWGSTVVDLVGDSVDATIPTDIYVDRAQHHGAHVNLAHGNSYADGQKEGEANADVLVYENLDWFEVGNYSGGDGMQSTRTLAESIDVDVPYVAFTPYDNSYGKVQLEVIQKTYNTVRIIYASNGAGDQTKYFYFRVANTLVDGSLQETTFQWSGSTTSASTTGINVQLKLDGSLQVTGGWSDTTNQGVDAFEHVAEARVQSVTRDIEFTSTIQQETQFSEFAVDCGFNWNLNTIDDNWEELVMEASKLEGEGRYNSVIGFGKITIMKNHDGTDTGCPHTYHQGTDTGNPELTADRTVNAFVSYVDMAG